MATQNFKSKYFKELNDFLKLRSGFKKLVFTNGCFDIIHVGHVRYLEAARKLGDVLVVGLNTDSSVKAMNKVGPGRPINILENRAEVLSAFWFVDFIISFSEKTALELVKKIRPEIYTKGGDWKLETIPEAKFVSSYGGEFQSIPFVEGYSSTSIIKKINESK